MNFIPVTATRNIGIGVLALLASITLVYAQRPQDPQRDERGRDERAPRSEPSPRGEPAPRVAPAPARASVERPPVVVDRVNHGSIRHVDTQVFERPADPHREVEVRRPVTRRGDVEVDVDHARFWHGFVFGHRVRGLRDGYRRLFLNGMPYFYDGGIYYQQMGEDYQEVYPPVGAMVPELPDGAIGLEIAGGTYYYAGGAFYVQQEGGFVIVAPPLGAIVPELPPGSVAVSLNGRVVYQFNGVFYQPVFVNGETQYMIVAS